MKNLKKTMFTNEKQRWSLRKVSVGLASVMLGLTFMTTSQSVKADTLNEEPGITQSISNTQITDDQESKETDIEKDEQTSSNEKNISSLSDIEKDTMNNAENQYLSSNSTSNAKSENREKNEQVNSKGVDTSSLSDIEKDVTSDENNQYSSSDSISSFKSKNREKAEQTNIEEDQSSLSDIEKDITNDEKGQPHSSASTSSSESENRERTEQTNTKEVDKPSLSNTKKDIVNNENNQSLPSNSTSSSKSKNKPKNKQINHKEEENKSSAVIKKDTADKKKDQSFLSHSTFGSEFKNEKNTTSDKDSSRFKNNSSKSSQPNTVSKNNNHTILKHDSIDTSKKSNLSNEKAQEETALEKLKKQNSLKTKKLIDQYSTLLKSISKDDWKEGFPEEKDATVKTDGMDIEIGKVEDGPFPLVNNIIKGNKKSYTYVNSKGINSRLGFIRKNQTRPLFLHDTWWDSNDEDSYKYVKKNGNLIIVHSSKYQTSYSPDGVEESVEKNNQGVPKISVVEGSNNNENYNFSVNYSINEYLIVTPDGDIIHKIDFKNVGNDSNANNNWRYYILIDTSLNNDDGTSLHSTGKGKNGIYLTNNDLLYGVRGLGNSEVYAVDYSKAGYCSDWRDSDTPASNYNIDEKITGKELNEIKDTAFRIMTPEMTLKEGESATIWYYEVPMIDSLNESLSKISDEINKEESRRENEIKQDSDLNDRISNVNDNVVVQVNKVKDFEKRIDKNTPDWLKNTLDLKYSDFLKGTIHLGVKAIPYVGPYLEALLSDAESIAKLTPKFKKTLSTLKTDFKNYRKNFKNLSMKLNDIVNDVKNPLKLSKRIRMAISKKVKTVKVKGEAINKGFTTSINKIRTSFEKEVSSWLKEIPGLIMNNSMLSKLFDKIPKESFIKKYMTKDGIKDTAKEKVKNTKLWKKAEKNGSKAFEKVKNNKVVKKGNKQISKVFEKVKNSKIGKKVVIKGSKFKNKHKLGTNYIKNVTKESKSKINGKGKELIKKKVKKGVNNIASKDKHIAQIRTDSKNIYDKGKKDTKSVETQVTDWLAKRIVSNFKLFPSYKLFHNVTAYPNEVENRILSTLRTTKEQSNQEKVKRLTA